jgi:Glycosyl hydrolases family 16
VAVFVDGWTVEAAARVAGVDEDRALEGTETLARHSLIYLDRTEHGPRSRMLGTVREFHTYAAEWTPEFVAFFVDHTLVKLVEQSPGYPMQFTLGIYEFPEDGPPSQPARPHPKQFVVDAFRGYQPTTPRPAGPAQLDRA